MLDCLKKVFHHESKRKVVSKLIKRQMAENETYRLKHWKHIKFYGDRLEAAKQENAE